MELIRLWYIKLYGRTERNFAVIGTNAVAFPLVHFYSAIAAGLGFGFTHVMLTYGEFIMEATHEGALFPAQECRDSHSAFLNAAIISLMSQIVHICITIYGFDFYLFSTTKETVVMFICVTVCHVLFSFIPMFGVAFKFCHSASVLGGVLTTLFVIATVVLVTRRGYRSRKRVHVD